MSLHISTLFMLVFQISATVLSPPCSEQQLYQHKKSAQSCYNKILARLDLRTSCEVFDSVNSDCDGDLKECFDKKFQIEMKDFYLEKAIQLKQWITLAHKLLDNSHSKSVFYFFSPFLVHFCSLQESSSTK